MTIISTIRPGVGVHYCNHVGGVSLSSDGRTSFFRFWQHGGGDLPVEQGTEQPVEWGLQEFCGSTRSAF